MHFTRQKAAAASHHLRSRTVSLNHSAESTAQRPRQRSSRLNHGVTKLRAPKARRSNVDSPPAACGEVPGLEIGDSPPVSANGEARYSPQNDGKSLQPRQPLLDSTRYNPSNSVTGVEIESLGDVVPKETTLQLAFISNIESVLSEDEDVGPLKDDE